MDFDRVAAVELLAPQVGRTGTVTPVAVAKIGTYLDQVVDVGERDPQMRAGERR